MNRLFKRAAIVLSAATLSVMAVPAAAGPFDFLKRIGNSIAHPRRNPPAHKRAPQGNEKESGETNTAKTAATAPEPQSAPIASTTKTATTIRVATPATSSASTASGARRDLPYGVPVPDRPGFVLSPYAPTGGFVDVRGFPGGTEVKDPFTEKIFLTP